MEGQAGTTRQVVRLDRVRGKEWSPAGERRWSSSKGKKRIWKSAGDIIHDVDVRRRHSPGPPSSPQPKPIPRYNPSPPRPPSRYSSIH
jgi:hypothetical protein